MYAPNSALLNALAHHKINFKQVLKFIDSRYDFEPTAFQNGSHHNAAGDNQGSCKVFCFAHLNNFNQLDTLALFAEHYQAVKDNPDGTDHQNIRQFMHHGWAGIHFDGHALTPKANIDEINAQAASLYANGGSEFEEIAVTEAASQEPVDAQPGATPLVNEPSEKLSENMQNFAAPSAPKDADGSVDHTSGSTAAFIEQSPAVSGPEHAATEPLMAEPQANSQPAPETTLDENRLDAKAEQAILEAQAVNQHVIPPAPGSSTNMATETTYYTNNDSVADESGTGTESNSSSASPELPADANHHGNASAAELTAANAVQVADNPAAFIDDHNTTSDTDQAATAQPQQPAQREETTQAVATSAVNASGLAAVSASEIAASNANHIADNPAEFIAEKNTSTDPAEPATGAEDHTHASTTTEHSTHQPILDGHGAADPAHDATRDGELTEKVVSSENQSVNKP